MAREIATARTIMILRKETLIHKFTTNLYEIEKKMLQIIFSPGSLAYSVANVKVK